MKNEQQHSVTLAATDRVSIYHYKDRTSVTFEETRETKLVVEQVDTEEFLRACSYFISSMSKIKDLSNMNQVSLESILDDLKLMERNKAPEVTA